MGTPGTDDLSDTRESASPGCALLIGLSSWHLASCFWILTFTGCFFPSAFWTFPLYCLRDLCLAPPPLLSPLLPVDLAHHR